MQNAWQRSAYRVLVWNQITRNNRDKGIILIGHKGYGREGLRHGFGSRQGQMGDSCEHGSDSSCFLTCWDVLYSSATSSFSKWLVLHENGHKCLCLPTFADTTAPVLALVE
jgi:hypothetical protein